MTGSHQKWAENFATNSEHNIHIFSLPGRHWKWRMHGAAITLAEKIFASKIKADLFLLTDMVDASLFKALISCKYPNTPIAIYFHENQLTYPWSKTDQDVQLNRDNHYAFINYSSALVCDAVIFNSKFHKEDFLKSLPTFLKQFPDYENLTSIQIIKDKSSVLYVGLELKQIIIKKENNNKAKTILWNHRWEYDKNPQLFYELMLRLSKENVTFNLIIAGEATSKYPKVFDKLKKELGSHIIHFGYADSTDKYNQLLMQSDILPVTSIQEFFGISILEAVAYGVFPLLPNRLVYPEHIPSEHQKDHLYESNEELYQKLKSLLVEGDLSFDNSWVKKYFWTELISLYDQQLSTIQQL